MADDKNIGASRLIGTNNLQQAVDALTTQVNKIANDFSKLSGSFNNLTGFANRTTGGSRSGFNWNAGSNRNNYSNNGGGGVFSGRTTFGMGGGGNGGGGRFGGVGLTLSGGAKIAGTIGAGAGILSALTAYGNQNMPGNFQMNTFGAQAAVAGGGGTSGLNLAMRSAFSNNNLALSVNDAAQAAYINQFTFGNTQFNGQSNPLFLTGMRQTQGFGYASPTLGASAAATAAQQTYTARALRVSQGLGLAPTILPGGVPNSMGNIAQSIYQRTFGNRNINLTQFNAATRQGGSLNVNLQYIGQQMGWNQTTIQEYQNYLQGRVAAQNAGISASQYDTLTQQAANGNKSAISQLTKATGLGASMFENQRNLNATRLTRQEDILQSLGPAFNTATQIVNNFSAALTSLLQNTGLDKLIGGGAAFGSVASNSLSGFSGAFGAAGGLFAAARLFGGGGGLLGRLGGLFGRGAGSAGGGMMTATRGANGAYNITSLGAGGAGAGSAILPFLGGATLAGAAVLATGAVHSKLSAAEANRAASMPFNPSVPFPAGYTQADMDAMKAAEIAARVYNLTGKEAVGRKMDWEQKYYKSHPAGQATAPKMVGTAGGRTDNAPGSGTPLRSGSSYNGASAAQVIKIAETQLGVPYVWGGEDPGKGMDCSGLMQWAFGQAGVKLPRTSQEQQNAGSRVAVNNTQPGDLLFVGQPAHHVVMDIGGGKILEAPHTGANVRIRALNPSEYTSASRVVGSVGNINSLLNSNTSGPNTLNNQQNTSGGNLGGYGGVSEAAAIASALMGSVGSLPLNSGSTTAAGTGIGSVGSNPIGNGQNDKASLQAYAKQLLSKYGWGDQWNSFNALVMSESGWDVHATNPSSGAYGIAQALPASKYASAGSDWQSNGDTQLMWMMDYIKNRYTSPNNAWSFHQKNNWYASGAWNIDQDQAAQVHKGEMILPAKQAETVRNAIASMMTTGVGNGAAVSGGTLSIGAINIQLPQGYSGTQQEARATGKMIVDTIVNDTRIKNLQRGQ